MSTSPVVTDPPQEPVEPDEAAEQTDESEDIEQQPDAATEIASLRAKLDEVLSTHQRQVTELTDTVKYWANKANGKPNGTPPDTEKEPEAQPEIEAEALTNLIVKGDVKSLKQYFKDKMGLVDREEIEAQRDLENKALAEIHELRGKYPELRDESSELYLSALKRFEELKKDPNESGRPGLFTRAVKDVRLEFLERDAAKPKESQPEPLTPSREARIAAQSGAVSKRKSITPPQQPLTDQQRLNAKRYGISEDRYRKQLESLSAARRTDAGA